MASRTQSPTASGATTPAGGATGSSILPMWMRQSLDHFNTKTSLEDFGTSPPENESVFLHEPLQNYSLSNLSKKSTESACAPSSLVFKSKEVKPRTGRQHHQQLLASYSSTQDQVCPQMNSLTPNAPLSEAGSAATTPSVTPQQSPTLIRKILAADLGSNNSHCKAGSNMLDSSKIAKFAPVTRVTNFDLNAVSPTSW